MNTSKVQDLPLREYFPQSSSIAYGCMGLGGTWDDTPITVEDRKQAEAVVEAALEAGINFFDHADIYTRGKAEAVFGEILSRRKDLRDQLILQTKAGIRLADAPPRYDWSPEWLRHRLEQSLKSLKVEQIDIWLLHRPDPLAEPEAVAALFHELQAEGKVRHFGVSNMNQHQIEYLQRYLNIPLIVNQLEISLAKLDWLNEGVLVNAPQDRSAHFPAGLLEYSRAKGMQIQSWGSLANGQFSGRILETSLPTAQATTALVKELSEAYQTSPEGILLSWIIRHPARIQPVIGTTNPQRIRACAPENIVELNREDWYRLFLIARGDRLP